MRYIPKQPEPIDAIQIPNEFTIGLKEFLRNSTYSVNYKEGCMIGIEMEYEHLRSDVCIALTDDYIIYEGIQSNIPMFRIMDRTDFEKRYQVAKDTRYVVCNGEW